MFKHLVCGVSLCIAIFWQQDAAAAASGDFSATATPALSPFPATYAGDLPCADCAGIRWHLGLLADQAFHLRMTYLGKTPEASADFIGRWRLDLSIGVLTLSGTNTEALLFEVLGNDRLRKLDTRGKPIVSKLNYELKRLADFSPIEPRLTLAGMYRNFADSGMIQLCATQQHIPVAMEADNAALERAYAGAKSQDNEELLVTLEGRITSRMPMEGIGPRATLVVQRFESIWPRESCPERAVQVSLTNTYWRLTRLEGAAISLKPGQHEAHLILQLPTNRVVGSGGCNRLMGSYQLDADKLTFGKTASTMMACPTGMEDEQRFHAMLSRVSGWKVDGKHLELFDSNGRIVSRFEAVALP